MDCIVPQQPMVDRRWAAAPIISHSPLVSSPRRGAGELGSFVRPGAQNLGRQGGAGGGGGGSSPPRRSASAITPRIRMSATITSASVPPERDGARAGGSAEGSAARAGRAGSSVPGLEARRSQ